jgi:hypothetical protein
MTAAQSLPLVAAVCLAFSSSPQGVPKPAQRAFPESSQRGSARIFYWGGDRSGGQVQIDYGQPAWKESYDEAVEKQIGVRWRLGQDFWTRLDSNMDLSAGDVDIPAGPYYLALERQAGDRRFVLWLLDPVEIRDQKLDAFQVAQTTGGVAVPMTWKKAGTPAAKLSIRLEVDATRKDGANLVIHFGGHELSAQLTMNPDRS